MFCKVGTMPSTAVMCCCSRVKEAGVDRTVVVSDVDRPAVRAGAGSWLTRGWLCDRVLDPTLLRR
jgi:hypothetical protein